MLTIARQTETQTKAMVALGSLLSISVSHLQPGTQALEIPEDI